MTSHHHRFRYYCFFLFQFPAFKNIFQIHCVIHCILGSHMRFITHTMLSHTPCYHTYHVITHTMLSHTSCYHTHHVITHTILSHTPCYHTHHVITHTMLSHTPCYHTHHPHSVHRISRISAPWLIRRFRKEKWLFLYSPVFCPRDC